MLWPQQSAAELDIEYGKAASIVEASVFPRNSHYRSLEKRARLNSLIGA